MSNTINPLRIEQIKNTSVPFPIFYFKNGDESNVTNAIYVSGIGPNNVNLMPQSITMTRENGNGNISTAIYQLVSSSTKKAVVTNPIDN